MKIQHYDFYGRPAKVTLDEDDIPDTCEVFDAESDKFVTRDDLLLDVTDSSGSYWLSEDAFHALLERVRKRAASAKS